MDIRPANLTDLRSRCRASLDQDPVRFFALERVASLLEDLWQGGQLESATYEVANSRLIPLIEGALAEKGGYSELQKLLLELRTLFPAWFRD
jgi:hypothetical protein